MYYIVLMIVTVVRTTETEPNAIIRIGYLLAFFMPIVLKYSELFSVCLVSFMTVGTYSFAYSFFPYQLVIYPIICLFTYIICKGGYGLSLTKNGALLFFSSIYVLLVDVLNGGSPQNIFYSLLLIIFFVLLKGGNATYNLSLMFNGFAATSLALSIVYLSNYEKFVVSYGQGEFERSGWTDPNYLSSIIGMGILTSFVQILRKRNAALPLKLFWIVCAGLSLISQLLMASRGGILATALSIVIVFMFMKIRSIYKVGVFVILCVFIFWLYNSGFFDLLEYRILSDDGSGSGRTVIWVKKLNAFIEEGNPLQWIFGLGYESAFKLAGEGRNVSVVSLPSTDIFDAQDEEYRESVLPSNVAARVAVEAGIADYWYKYVGLKGAIVGMTGYGESAPADKLFPFFGFTAENIVAKAHKVLGVKGA